MLHRLDTLDDVVQVYDPPGPIPLDKVVEQFDDHISAFMREATLVLANVRDPEGNPVAVVLGGRPGFARVVDPLTASIEIPVESWPMAKLRPGRNTPYETGLLFVIPGIKETLRAKGRLAVAPAENSATLSATLSLDNSFFHCAKAFIRSHVWDDPLKLSRWAGLRAFRCVEKVRESAVITSFHLRPVDGGDVPGFVPGQHVAIEVAIPGADEPLRRVYSLSNRPGEDRLRISVKREPAPAVGSAYLHDCLEVGDIIELRNPSGSFKLDLQSRRPAVLLSAGVGLTPMISMLDHLVAGGSERPVWFFHGAISGAQHAMAEHVRSLARAHGQLHMHTAYSRPSTEDVASAAFDTHGRLSVELLRRHLPADDYEFYVCGPNDFMKSIVEDLIADGVAADRIRWEAFAGNKPVIGMSDETAAPAEDVQGATVHFSRSGKTVEWDRRYGSLLDLAESIGISARSSCRAGTCFSCSTKVVSGEVRYREELEDAPDEGTALICCARPAGPVTLDL